MNYKTIIVDSLPEFVIKIMLEIYCMRAGHIFALQMDVKQNDVSSLQILLTVFWKNLSAHLNVVSLILILFVKLLIIM